MKHDSKKEKQVIVKAGTQNKTTAQLLKNSELKYRQLFEAAQDGILILDAKTAQIIDVNPFLIDMLGYTKKEFLGRKLWEVGPFLNTEAAKSAFVKLQRQHYIRYEDMPLETKDGKPISVEFVSNVYSVNGTIVIKCNIRNITDRKKAEAALKESEDKYRRVVEQANDGICIIQDRLVKYANLKLAEIRGSSVEELLNTPFINYIHPDDIPMITDRYNQRMAGQQIPSIYETTLIGKEGNKIHAELNVGIINYLGKPAELVTIRDITERKKMEQVLRQSEEKNRTILKIALDGFTVDDLEGRLLEVNDSYCKMTGYNREELLTMSIHDLEVVEKPEKTAQHIKKILEQGYDRFETRHKRKDGTIIDLDISVNYVDLKGGQLFVSVRDITKRKLAEEALRQSEQNFRNLFENAVAGIFQTTPDGHIITANKAFAKMHGYNSVTEMLSEITDISTQLYANKEDREKLIRIIDERGVVESNEFMSHDRNGNTFWVSSFLRGIKDSSGKLVRLEGISINITDRKQAEEEITHQSAILKSVIESYESPIFSVDRNYCYTSFNNAHARFMKFMDNKDIEIGKNFLDYITNAEDRVTAQTNIDLALKGNHLTHEDHHGLSNPSYLEISHNPIYGQNSETIGVSVFARDLTKQKQASDELERSYAKLQKTLEETVDAISGLCELRDPYTAGHQTRVSALACAIANEIGLKETTLTDIRIGCALHDTGKINIPAEILSKPGKLSDMEFRLIKNHPEIGYEILKRIGFPSPVATMVLQHHERLDGSGYPGGLKGDEIIIESKVLAVADVVEAMFSHRPYRPALGIDKALEEIAQNKGILYDVDVADACIRLFNEKNFHFE